ncbi:hypothetical protein ACCO45_004123 [Purpureocillium lilacinum]|uniref:Uncharacterized protein n=1 Tax=Purpureocillium lilacinum TaxID=33203 RepID=A0ACC4E4L9_PURLI
MRSNTTWKVRGTGDPLYWNCASMSTSIFGEQDYRMRSDKVIHSRHSQPFQSRKVSSARSFPRPVAASGAMSGRLRDSSRH